MVTLKLFYTAISTVFKVVAAVVVGMVLSPFLNDREASEKGLSFIALRVLLPSMLFGNLTLDISLSLLREYYWAIVMSLVPQILGVIFAVAVRKSIDKEWRVLLVLGSTFQNGLVFPLSIVTNIKGVSWLDREAVARCEQYVFLYNLTCALGLWSIGNVMVKFHKDKLVARLRDLEEERLYLDKQRERTVRKHLRGALSDRKTRRRSCRRRERPTTSAISDINTLAAVLDTNTSNEKVMEKLEQEVESSFSSVTSEESDSTSDVTRSTQSAPPSLDGEGEEEAPESLAQLHRYWYRPVRRHARPISMEKFNQLFSGEGEEAVLPSERAARKSAHRDKPPARASRRGRKKKVPLTAEQRQALYQDLLTNVPVPGVADPSSPLGGRGAFPERSAQDRTEVDVFLHNSERPFSYQYRRILGHLWTAVNMPPAYISFVAIAISLTPPLRWCAESVPGLAFIQGVATLGTGCVPVQLVTLGITLSTSTKGEMIKTAKELPRRFSEYPWFRRTTPSHRTSAPAPPPRSLTVGAKSTSASAAVTNEPVSAEHIINAQPVFSFHHHHHHHHHVEEGKKEVQTGLASSSIFAGLLQKWKSLSNATRFGFLCIFLRLLLLPAISFLIVYGLLKAGILPSDPSFVISILIGISSPAAVNGSLICTMHGYFATQYARMIFLMYCLAVLSSALWLTISVYYAGLLNASQHAHQ